jgi:flagellar hook-associated protein 2
MSTSVSTGTSPNDPPITFSGLGTGIDTSSIVDKLMQLERQPITKLAQDRAVVVSKQSVIQELNGLVTALRDKAQALLDPEAFASRTATSSDSGVLTATASSAAANGSYNVEVTALAKAHTMASTAGPALSDDTLHIAAGSTTVDVATKATDSLQSVADRINAAGAPVSASVVNSRLVLISKTVGAGGAMSVTSDGGQAAALGLATTQPGQDAAATVNGLPVTSSGNVISGAIAGVDLSLVKLGSVTVNVGTDKKAIQDRVQAFVDAYNAVLRDTGALTKYDPATKTKGTLQGDQTITGFSGQLRGLAGAQVGALAGLPADSLAQIGITSDRSGQLTLDATTLGTALDDDPQAVADVFTKDDGNGQIDTGDGVAVRIADFARSFSSDTLSARLSGYTSQLAQMDKKNSDLEALMTIKEQRLRQQFSAMDVAVAQLQAQGADLASRLAAL